MTELTVRNSLLDLLPAVRDSVVSDNTKRAYGRALAEFVTWNGGEPLTRSRILAYRQTLLDRGLSSSSINLATSAIRRVAEEAGLRGLIPSMDLAGIRQLRNLPNRGTRMGRWLEDEQILAVLSAPDQSTNRGMRDFIALGLLFGCGLRRSEAVTLRCEQVVSRGGRTVLCDVVGKGRKVRSTVVPVWLAGPMAEWIGRIGEKGHVLRRVRQTDAVAEQGISGTAIAYIVVRCAKDCGYTISPHDLRRTHSALALQHGANLEQIRQALGHASLATTTKYVAGINTLRNPACDFLL